MTDYETLEAITCNAKDLEWNDDDPRATVRKVLTALAEDIQRENGDCIDVYQLRAIANAQPDPEPSSQPMDAATELEFYRLVVKSMADRMEAQSQELRSLDSAIDGVSNRVDVFAERIDHINQRINVLIEDLKDSAFK